MLAYRLLEAAGFKVTVGGNIGFGLEMLGKPREEVDSTVKAMLRLVRMEELEHRPVSQISGGQQQRVALARALATRPQIIFADEPTGNLDSRSGAEVLRLLREAVDGLRQTVAMVTHDPVAAACADAVIFLADGQVVDIMTGPTPARVLDRMGELGGTS